MHPWFTVKKAGSIRSLLICFIAVVGVLLQQLDGDECKSLHRLIVIENIAVVGVLLQQLDGDE